MNSHGISEKAVEEIEQIDTVPSPYRRINSGFTSQFAISARETAINLKSFPGDMERISDTKLTAGEIQLKESDNLHINIFPMNIKLRSAILTDCPNLGCIHVSAWQEAYRGLLPAEYLKSLKSSDRQNFWTRELSNPTRRGSLLVAEVNNEIGGFISFGPQIANSCSNIAEIHAINIDPKYWRNGLGSLLLKNAIDHLKSDGFTECILWVLPENNRAIHFYTSHGWQSDGHIRQQEIFGSIVDEVRYSLTLSPTATSLLSVSSKK